MRLICLVLLGLLSIDELRAQDAARTSLKNAPVEIELDATSFFTDMAVTAVVTFPEIVSEPLDLPGTDSQISIISVEVTGDPASPDTASLGTIRFLPRKTGLVTIPTFEFQSATTSYLTQPKQILVSSPSVSEAMIFSMVPAKTKVYAGEPLRIDVTWKADLKTNQIRSLQCFPDLFSRPDARIEIPRCSSPEDQQIGLPFGGRRIAARRIAAEQVEGAPSEKLGTVTFPIFVKFEQPGSIDLPASRLEIAHLKAPGGALAPYAVFFNNGLFDPRTSLEAFDRYYVEAPAFSIEVLPLPVEGQSEYFSGLFEPCSISVSVKNTEIEVGEVIEVNLRVQSEAPHGMLELPVLGIQRSLRGRFRTGPEYGRTWFEDGTGFLGRIRALTTDVTALPSLQFQVFDPATGQYRIIQTKAQPLTVKPQDGRHFFDVRSLAPETTFTNQPEGVWHNAKPETMRDLINSIIGLLADYMWLLLLPGPIAFVLLLPRVKELRRRAINPQYRSQAEAYEAFCKLPEQCEAKWEAFRSFLATSFSMPGGAWTPGDTASRLRQIGIAEDDVVQVLATHQKMDTTDFSSQKPQSDLPQLNDLAGRLYGHFRKTVPALLATLFLLPSLASASDWDEAESLFEKALTSPSGEPATESLFTQSALKFEAAATGKIRPGASWFNAGNAWFKAGEVGRAISCYRQARIYRPFDNVAADNLLAARALAVDVVEDSRRLELSALPVRWLCAALVLMSWIIVAALLLHIRYQTKISLWGAFASLAILLCIISITIVAASHSEKEGVVVVGSIYGRKGPAYSYEKAFNEPLHDGLEFEILEEREKWLFVSLADQKICWIPADQVKRIRNTRS